jgi:hypothetical protein
MRPWVCMHGKNIDLSGGCIDCERALRRLLHESRQRYELSRLAHERQYGEAQTIPWRQRR